MLSRIKTGCKKYGIYIALGVASVSRLIGSMGDSLFRTEGTMQGILEVNDEQNPFVFYASCTAVALCGASLLLTIVPLTCRKYLSSNNQASQAQESAEEEKNEDCVPQIVVALGWTSMGFIALSFFNGSIRIFDFVREGHQIDPNDEELKYLILAMLNSGFQLYTSYVGGQEEVIKNARLYRSVIDGENEVSLNALIIADTALAGFLAYQGVYGALAKIPGSKALPNSVQDLLALTSVMSASSTRFIQKGMALKRNFSLGFKQPQTTAGKNYYAITTIVGIPDSVFTGGSSFNSVLFFAKEKGMDCGLSSLAKGSLPQKAVVLTALGAGAVYGVSNWTFNTKRQRERVLEMIEPPKPQASYGTMV